MGLAQTVGTQNKLDSWLLQQLSSLILPISFETFYFNLLFIFLSCHLPLQFSHFLGFYRASHVAPVLKNPCVSAGDMGLIPGLGDPLEEGTGNPLQYSCLGNPRDRGVWHATVRGVSKNQTWLSTHKCTEFYTKLSVSGTLSGSLFNSFEHLFSSFVFSGQWYDSDCYLSTCSPVISPELYIYKLIYYKHLPTQHLSLFKYRVVTSDWLVITEMEPFMHSMQLAPSVSPSSQQPKLQDWNLRAL